MSGYYFFNIQVNAIKKKKKVIVLTPLMKLLAFYSSGGHFGRSILFRGTSAAPQVFYFLFFKSTSIIKTTTATITFPTMTFRRLVIIKIIMSLSAACMKTVFFFYANTTFAFLTRPRRNRSVFFRFFRSKIIITTARLCRPTETQRIQKIIFEKRLYKL